MKKVRAGPRRIPAFGEWNYYDDGGYGYGDGGWPATRCLDSALQAGLVIALPASPKPLKKVVKWSDSGTLEVDGEQRQRQRQKVVVGLREEHGPRKQGKPIEIYVKVPDADDAHLTTPSYKTQRVRAVKAVDEDLYVIPPDMLCHNNNPRKRLTKRLWIGCLGGLSCVA